MAFTGNQAALRYLGDGKYIDDSTGHYWSGSSLQDATDHGTTDPGAVGSVAPAPAAAAPPAAAPAAGAAPAAAPAGGGLMNAQQAKAYIEGKVGHPLSDADVAGAYQEFGGDPTSMHSEADLAPVVARFQGGAPAGGPAGTGTSPLSPGGTQFGAAPAPFESDVWTGGSYTPAPWTGGDFTDPTMADVEATPGYQTRLDAGRQARERSAAANGSVLSGGFQKAIERYGQDYGTDQYQTARGNALQNYQTRYGQFQDANTAGQQGFNNQYSQFLDTNSRKQGDYILNATNTRNAELDYWSRLKDLYGPGATIAAGSYRPGA